MANIVHVSVKALLGRVQELLHMRILGLQCFEILGREEPVVLLVQMLKLDLVLHNGQLLLGQLSIGIRIPLSQYSLLIDGLLRKRAQLQLLSQIIVPNRLFQLLYRYQVGHGGLCLIQLIGIDNVLTEEGHSFECIRRTHVQILVPRHQELDLCPQFEFIGASVTFEFRNWLLSVVSRLVIHVM